MCRPGVAQRRPGRRAVVPRGNRPARPHQLPVRTGPREPAVWRVAAPRGPSGPTRGADGTAHGMFTDIGMQAFAERPAASCRQPERRHVGAPWTPKTSSPPGGADRATGPGWHVGPEIAAHRSSAPASWNTTWPRPSPSSVSTPAGAVRQRRREVDGITGGRDAPAVSLLMGCLPLVGAGCPWVTMLGTSAKASLRARQELDEFLLAQAMEHDSTTLFRPVIHGTGPHSPL